MNIDELLQLKKQQDEQLTLAAQHYLSQLTDTTIDVNVRWELFGKLRKIDGLLKKDSWACHSIDSYNLSWYNDFYVERYTYVDYYCISEVWTDLVEDDKVTQEQYDSWRETILASGNIGFTYDW